MLVNSCLCDIFVVKQFYWGMMLSMLIRGQIFTMTLVSCADISTPPLNSVNPVIMRESASLVSSKPNKSNLKTLKSRSMPTSLTPFSETESTAFANLLLECCF